jgi:hypothetical protein
LARSLDSILSDEPSVHSLPDAPDSAGANGGSERVSQGDSVVAVPADAKAPSADAPAPADDSDEDGEVPDTVERLAVSLNAARGDKRKFRKQWQEVEREKARLEGEIAALRRQMQQPPAPQQQPQTPEDPDAEFYTAGPGKFWQTREQAIEAKIKAQAFEVDRRAMRRTTKDYGEAEAAFEKAVQNDPSLVAAFRASDDPVGFIYEEGKKRLRLQQLGATSIEDLEAKIRAQVVAELEGKQPEAEPEPTKPARPPIPKSHAGSRGSGAGIPQAWSGPRSIKDILA